MTTDSDDGNTDDTGAGDSTPQALRQRVKQLEKENQQITELQNELKTFKTQEAIRDAGMKDLNERQVKALLASHDGDLTADALRKTAEELKFVDPAQEIDKSVQDAHEKAQAASRGAQTVGQLENYEAEIATARNRDEVIAIARKYDKPIENRV